MCLMLHLLSSTSNLFLGPYSQFWLIGKDPDGGKDWRQKGKRATEDEMVGWHHLYNGHGSGQTQGEGEGQGGLVCCSPRGCTRVRRDLVTEQQQKFSVSGPFQKPGACPWLFSLFHFEEQLIKCKQHIRSCAKHLTCNYFFLIVGKKGTVNLREEINCETLVVFDTLVRTLKYSSIKSSHFFSAYPTPLDVVVAWNRLAHPHASPWPLTPDAPLMSPLLLITLYCNVPGSFFWYYIELGEKEEGFFSFKKKMQKQSLHVYSGNTCILYLERDVKVLIA